MHEHCDEVEYTDTLSLPDMTLTFLSIENAKARLQDSQYCLRPPSLYVSFWCGAFSLVILYINALRLYQQKKLSMVFDLHFTTDLTHNGSSRKCYDIHESHIPAVHPQVMLHKTGWKAKCSRSEERQIAQISEHIHCPHCLSTICSRGVVSNQQPDSDTCKIVLLRSFVLFRWDIIFGAERLAWMQLVAYFRSNLQDMKQWDFLVYTGLAAESNQERLVHPEKRCSWFKKWYAK